MRREILQKGDEETKERNPYVIYIELSKIFGVLFRIFPIFECLLTIALNFLFESFEKSLGQVG